jgi:hypothetical protein
MGEACGMYGKEGRCKHDTAVETKGNVWSNSEVRSCNHCWSRNAISIIF